MKTKKLAILVCCVLVLVGAAGATLAWLTDQTQTINNTFTVGNIDITLEESGTTDADGDESTPDQKNSFKMIPGFSITKDPKVTVDGGSEDCWLFVELVKSDNFDTFMTYGMADGWEKLEGVNNVYCRKVAANEADQSFAVIADNTVTVNDTVKKSDMDALTDATLPTLTVKAYAVQLFKTNKDEFAAAEAWAKLAH